MPKLTNCWDKYDNLFQEVLQQLWSYLPIIGAFMSFILKKLRYFYNLRDFGSFLLSMSINNNEVSFLQVMAGNRCCKSYLEHSCSTKYFSNLQAQNYFHGTMSQFDHQFCDEESRLGKSKTFYFVKKSLLY